jgi:hypothetical protein
MVKKSMDNRVPWVLSMGSTRANPMDLPMEGDNTPNKRKHRSWVWDYYNPIGDNLAKCKSCPKEYNSKNGTNAMISHLTKKHGTNDPEAIEKNKKLIFSETSDANKLLYVFQSKILFVVFVDFLELLLSQKATFRSQLWKMKHLLSLCVYWNLITKFLPDNHCEAL